MFTVLTKFKWQGLAIATIIILLFSLYFPGSAKIQGKLKKTISEVKYYPSTAKPPIRFQGLKVNGKEVNFSSMFEAGNKQLQKRVAPDEEFEEEDDFVGKTTFEVINVSEKKIIWIRFMIHLYTQDGVNKRSFDAAFAIDYGRPGFANKPPYSWMINPGGKETISVSENTLVDVRKAMGEKYSQVARVGVYASFIEFEDGTLWSGTSGKTAIRKASKQSKYDEIKFSSVPAKFTGILERDYSLGEAFVVSPLLSIRPNSCGGISLLADLGSASKYFYQLPEDPTCGSSTVCLSTSGSESMSCPTYSCIGTRENWYNPNHPNPPTSGTNTIRRTTLPIPCYNSSGSQCNTKFACTADSTCGSGDDLSNYCGEGASCNPTYNQLQSCSGSWSCSTCECLWGSPIIIDVEGDGYDLTSSTNGVDFDFPGEGTRKRWSWTALGSDDAFLFLDRNSNSLVDSGIELFGNYTFQVPPPSGVEKKGFLALAELDRPAAGGNGDGQIDSNDFIFPALRLWQDLNHNGISEPSELKTLIELGVAIIDLDYKRSRRFDRYGNEFRYRSKVRGANNTQLGRWAWDVFFQLNH